MRITVYRITGQQGWLRVPDWVCAECDLTVAAVRAACAGAEVPEDAISVLPWLTNLRGALAQGASHPPVVLVDGEVYSQGVVPDAVQLTEFLRRAQDRERAPRAGAKMSRTEPGGNGLERRRLVPSAPAPRFSLPDHTGRLRSPVEVGGSWQLLIFLRHRH